MNRFEYKAKKLEHQERLVELARDPWKDPANWQRTWMAVLPLVAITSGLASAACFGAASEATRTKTSGHLLWKKTTTSAVPTETRIGYLLAGIVLALITLALIAVAVRTTTRRAGLKKYPPILTGVETIKIQKISAITGQSVPRVYQDLRTLIDSGMLDDFYVDYDQEQVVSRKYIPKTSHKTVVTCSGCGGNNEVIIGITRKCDFCGQQLVLTATHEADATRATTDRRL